MGGQETGLGQPDGLLDFLFQELDTRLASQEGKLVEDIEIGSQLQGRQEEDVQLGIGLVDQRFKMAVDGGRS